MRGPDCAVAATAVLLQLLQVAASAAAAALYFVAGLADDCTLASSFIGSNTTAEDGCSVLMPSWLQLGEILDTSLSVAQIVLLCTVGTTIVGALESLLRCTESQSEHVDVRNVPFFRCCFTSCNLELSPKAAVCWRSFCPCIYDLAGISALKTILRSVSILAFSLGNLTSVGEARLALCSGVLMSVDGMISAVSLIFTSLQMCYNRDAGSFILTETRGRVDGDIQMISA